MSMFLKAQVKCHQKGCKAQPNELQLTLPMDAVEFDNFVLKEHAAHGNHELDVYLGPRLLWKFVEEEGARGNNPVTVKLGCDQCKKEWVCLCEKEMITSVALTFHTAHEGHRHWIGRVVGGVLIKYGPVVTEQMPAPNLPSPRPTPA